MLVLATLHRLLSQVISSPGLHTAALLTPNGQLVSYACDSTRSKDDVRLVVGLSSEIWLEVADQGMGMVDSELGRILVMGVQDAVAATRPSTDASPANSANTNHASDKPLMLVALSATEAVGWEDLEAKGRELTEHLSRAVTRLRKPLTAAATSTPSPPATRHGR
ncbi:hypothetical protein DFH94DRAFT_737193 [Russula ochroleuca]|jgi:hypothetical protein|uniref:Roadblock/LAMTOR2 domain-containing protein n=1 Tax=Russula ochroleuca TaxID=152965 RepID=A0A9P5T9U1_9AGAM|nr:hypothetical protein DFH94DRAFT_737193 [Russula ochroleuca]